MITRKLIKIIAKAFHDSKPQLAFFYGQWFTDVITMANALAPLNDRFDKERFIKLCETGTEE